MDHPYYTVTVTSLTRGWTYSAVEGEEWDPDDDVVLVSPFKYTWAFDGEQIPGHLVPFTADVSLVARTADDVPPVEIGDLIQFDVRIGTTGPRIIAPPPMRVAAADVELTDMASDQDYAAHMQIGLSDLSVDWRGRALAGHAGTSFAMRRQWRERFAEYGYLLGLSVGCPTTWDGIERPPHPFLSDLWAPVLLDYSAAQGYPGQAGEAFARTLNAHQPDGHTHAAVTVYAPAGHPAGYEYVGPSSWSADTGEGPIAEPSSAVRIELVAAGRSAPGSAGLPLTLDLVDGLLTVVPTEPAAGGELNQLGLDAEWCIIPAKARRSREAVINQVVLVGTEGVDKEGGGSEIVEGTYVYTDPDADTRGASTRQPPMDLHLGGNYQHSSNPYPIPWPAVSAAVPYFISDPTALASTWTYDGFTMFSRLVPQDIAEWLLPQLAPRLPDETDGDGRLVRNVVLYDLNRDIRFGGAAITGFVAAGSLTIAGGDMVWQLTTTPGRPKWTDTAPDPITLGDLVAYFGSLTFDDVDPHLAFGDLAYVGAAP